MTSYKIIKPKIDNNDYKYIKLSNELNILFISDKNTELSAAAMTIQAGFYDDPIESQGLAHFLEHMLFMGTDKHKEENYFHKFINEAGGMTNAHTMEESTTFYFQVLNEYFNDAIDIFSSFFIHPLLSKNAIDREIKAVNSEHKKNLTFDSARTSSILKEFVTNDHPYFNFGTGNSDTLTKPHIRDQLFELYNKYYSSNLMNLVILTNKNIDEIEENYVKLFSQIKNNNAKRSSINKLPFTNMDQEKKSLCMNLFKTSPVSETDTLTLFWQIPNMNKYYEYKPLDIISHLLGHESEGSIFYNLKEHDLCTFLHAGIVEEDSSFHLFIITLELTEKGFKHIPYIFECIYSYIKLIKKQLDYKELYEELQTINTINFDYSLPGEKIDYVADLSMNMVKYPTKDLLYGSYKLNNYNNTVNNCIKECLKYITKKNSLINISSKHYENTLTKVDKWYDAKYNSYLNPTSFGKEFKNKKFTNNLHLPKKNDFIPKNLKLFTGNNTTIPKKLYPNSDIWYFKDNKFNIPQINCSLILYTNKLHENVKNFIITELYFMLIEYQLNSVLYYASMCSSGFAVNIKHNYIIVTFYGYPDTILKIINVFIDTLLNLKITEKAFNFVKYDLKNNLLNFIYKPAFMIGMDYFKEKLYKINYTNNELLDGLHHITIKDMMIPKQWFEHNCYTKTFIYGNINDELMKEISNSFKIFNCNDSAQQIKNNNIILLNPGEEQLYLKKSLNKSDDNYFILIYFEIGNIIKNITKNWDHDVLCTLLIETHVKEKFFSQLRTIEQSGYIVKSHIQTFQDKKGYLLGISFLIQSPEFNPIVLRKKIRNFIKDMYNKLNELDDKKFTQYKLINKNLINKKFLTQDDEFGFYNTEIISGDYVFNVKEILASNIDKITKKQVVEFYEKHFINKATRKIRILEMYKGTSIKKN
ncbi:peptidase M16 [Fadolivirus algeromassiliense]|jgi:insulysin|uniref:Peptidase M16 n=1 Tax=Fadolivirus FV1/VV64 TaxID=3070911 RepID=A0A7D3V7D1_9VIRU|nr:peptidase M16 [Fadolivirus algeromassiliense]QKF93736.1 peptidase M16 [Fadolivirus FV1/VV64]